MLNLPVPSTLLYSIPLAAVTIYLPYLLVAYARVKVGYDLSAPRSMFDKLPPYARRATWAHQNCFESFMIYAPAALMAYVTGVDSQLALYAAIAYVTARVLFSVFYILNIPILRSLMFGVGSACIINLFVLSILRATS
ncbi:MAG: MAPEG family protein [Cylindrospermopsis raciborskii KL1]|jgi:uncharacterized MAPEG superfamily protein|uniref:MAPEG family protein n=1 Tax=Cylindrospermopsis raciborskii TaxID=77022 RepID=UPI001A1C884B|nr:MAPEG family protein [Cylindrospermopsis raciborskii]MBG0744257.1 MAPEG family protein [Cylindrospermopsis raciborskii KL1]